MHLSDCFLDLIARVLSLQSSAPELQPGYEEFRDDIDRRLAASDGYAQRREVGRDDYDQARFAVCAFVDEAILGSGWPHRARWLDDQLQRRHYHTSDAGEAFFTRLEGVGLHQREVREIYYLCLALGFAGRFCRPGEEHRLEQVRTANLKILLGSSLGLPCLERTELFPEAHPCGVQAGKGGVTGGQRLTGAACLAAPVALFALLYLVYRFTLGGIGENFLKTVGS